MIFVTNDNEIDDENNDGPNQKDNDREVIWFPLFVGIFVLIVSIENNPTESFLIQEEN